MAEVSLFETTSESASPAEGARILYESDRATVWLGDSRSVLPRVATESVALVITDPPYGQDWQSNHRSERFEVLAGDGAGDRDGIREVLEHAVRIVGQNRHLYVFGPTDVLGGLKVSEAVELVWDKANIGSGDLLSPWGPGHEPISFVVSKHRHGGKAGCSTVPTRVRKGSVLRFSRPTGRKVRHPSEKPIALLRELVESSSRQGEIVLDPFAGIGSTGVAAVLSGRRAVLVELDPRYASVAVERVRTAEEVARRGESI